MTGEVVRMPDGRPFEFWDDATAYRKVYHVAREDARASDDGPGTEARPFATIGRAAEVLEPGQMVVVHRGVYRECVRPARGGDGPDRMVRYQAAAGEEVVVRGSEVWRGPFRPSEGWSSRPIVEGRTVWMGDLRPEWFGAYNPFMAMNFSSEYTSFTKDWTRDEIHRFMLRRGRVLANGRALRQVFRYRDLAAADGAFWVEDPGLRLHFRLPGDADPGGADLEVTAREQVFAPAVRGLGYVRVSGFGFEHAADGVPIPQRAMVSAARGHHWIIEDCRLRHANACGLDVGKETWHAPMPPDEARWTRHIIRRNRVSDCGACGMAAVDVNWGSLVEDNVVERIGGLDLERVWETGGLKFHQCNHVLIRRNVFRHIRHAPGVWLDYTNRHSRVTENVFADIEGILGGCYIEVSHEPNWVDHNVFWDIRGVPAPPDRAYAGPGANIDSGERCLVAHNLFGRVRDWYAVACHLTQAARRVAGRTGLCREHRVLNNVFVACPKRVLFSRAEGNRSDGNLFDVRDDPVSLVVEFPAPRADQNLAGWQAHFGLDRSSTQAHIEASFDPETLALCLTVEGDLPACAAVPDLFGDAPPASPGPVPLKAGRHEFQLKGKRTSADCADERR
jgi:hypothetical protein